MKYVSFPTIYSGHRSYFRPKSVLRRKLLAGLGVSLAVTALMHEGVGFSATAAFAIALGAVFIFHFLANAFFVFDSGTDRNTFLRYAGATLVFRLVDFLLFAGLQGFVTPYYIAIALAILITNLVKFLIYRNFVFATRHRCPRVENMT